MTAVATQPVETKPAVSADVSLLARPYNLAPETVEQLVATFRPLAETAAALIEESRGIVVTDPSQDREIKQSRAMRLKIKASRVEIEKARKAMGEESLRRSQAINAVAKDLTGRITPEEDRLTENETIAERKQAEREAKLKKEREAELDQYEFGAVLPTLGQMEADQYAQVLEGAKLTYQRRQEATRKAAEEAAAEAALKAEEAALRQAELDQLRKEAQEREAAEATERARRIDLDLTRVAIIAPFLPGAASYKLGNLSEEEFSVLLEKSKQEKAERDRIKAEADAAAEKARKGREAAEAKALAERRAREKAEAELKARKDEEDRKAREAEEAKRRAAQAPDQDKLREAGYAIRRIMIPQMATPAGEAARKRVLAVLSAASKRIAEIAAAVGEGGGA